VVALDRLARVRVDHDWDEDAVNGDISLECRKLLGAERREELVAVQTGVVHR
jgi:hypothetical protein